MSLNTSVHVRRARFSAPSTQRFTLSLPVLILTASLAACGGGGGGSSSAGNGSGNDSGNGSGNDEPVVAPAVAAEPTFTVNATKQFSFSWADVADATFYRVLENPDGQSGYSQFGDDIPAGAESTSFEVPLFLRVEASYILASCNDAGCTESSAVSVTTEAGATDINNGVGYFKAANADVDDGGVAVTERTQAFRPAFNLDASRMVYGAVYEDSNSASVPENNETTDSGAVYVFDKDASGNWSQTAYLKAPLPTENEWFGSSVAITGDGNTIAVGAAGGSQAYIYQYENGSWQNTAILSPATAFTGSEATEYFGGDIDISDDATTVVVSAYRDRRDSTGEYMDAVGSQAGAVYVFELSSNTWSQAAYLKPEYIAERFYFGRSIDLTPDGSLLAVSAEGDPSTSASNGDQSNTDLPSSGAVFVYERSDSSWNEISYLKPDYRDLEETDGFGSAVSFNDEGDILAVGAYLEDSVSSQINMGEDDNDANGAGAAYIFTRSGATTWHQDVYIKAPNNNSVHSFGNTISISGDGKKLAVGTVRDFNSYGRIQSEIRDDNSSVHESGSAYVFENTGSEWVYRSYIRSPVINVTDTNKRIRISRDGKTVGISSSFESSDSREINGDMLNTDAPNSGAVFLY